MLSTTNFLNGFKWNNLLTEQVKILETGTEKYTFDLDKNDDHPEGDIDVGLVEVSFTKDYEKGIVVVSGGFDIGVSETYLEECICDPDDDECECEEESPSPCDMYQDEADWFVKDLFAFISEHYENNVVELQATESNLFSGQLTKKR